MKEATVRTHMNLHPFGEVRAERSRYYERRYIRESQHAVSGENSTHDLYAAKY